MLLSTADKLDKNTVRKDKKFVLKEFDVVFHNSLFPTCK